MSVAASDSSVGAGEAGTADGPPGGSCHAAKAAPLRRGAVILPKMAPRPARGGVRGGEGSGGGGSGSAGVLTSRGARLKAPPIALRSTRWYCGTGAGPPPSSPSSSSSYHPPSSPEPSPESPPPASAASRRVGRRPAAAAAAETDETGGKLKAGARRRVDSGCLGSGVEIGAHRVRLRVRVRGRVRVRLTLT